MKAIFLSFAIFVVTASAQAEWQAKCVSKNKDRALITFDNQALVFEAESIQREFYISSATSSSMTYSFSGATLGGYDEIIMPNFDNNEEIVSKGNIFKAEIHLLEENSPNFGKVISYDCKSY